MIAQNEWVSLSPESVLGGPFDRFKGSFTWLFLHLAVAIVFGINAGLRVPVSTKGSGHWIIARSTSQCFLFPVRHILVFLFGFFRLMIVFRCMVVMLMSMAPVVMFFVIVLFVIMMFVIVLFVIMMFVVMLFVIMVFVVMFFVIMMFVVMLFVIMMFVVMLFVIMVFVT